MNTLLLGLTNTTQTLNGTLSNITTNSPLIDFFFHAPARRGQDNTQLFVNAFNHDISLALKAACYLRDVRGGQGERETFRQILRYLNNSRPDIFKAILPLVIEFGRWDDILEFVENEHVVTLVSGILVQAIDGENSLLAKWMPSTNTSSKKTRKLAYMWVAALNERALEYYRSVLADRGLFNGYAPVNLYRRMLSELRSKLGIVERHMSRNNWREINYKQVPSNANLLYRKAFSKHDPERYTQFIEDAKQGKVKINSSTLYPYEIVSRLFNSQDETLEALWSQLPNYADHINNALVVCDVSGSMMDNSFGGPKPIFVSTSLTLYIAERQQGFFKDHFITFSEKPTLEKLQGSSLYRRLHGLRSSGWGYNTNLIAVFDLILNAAKRNNVPQSDMPALLFIISDMQFDKACPDNTATNFEVIERKYRDAGYQRPTIVFWNVNSEVTETPVTKDERGTFLVSGCSPAVLKMALSQDTSTLHIATPYEKMLDVLNNERYSIVDFALLDLI